MEQRVIFQHSDDWGLRATITQTWDFKRYFKLQVSEICLGYLIQFPPSSRQSDSNFFHITTWEVMCFFILSKQTIGPPQTPNLQIFAHKLRLDTPQNSQDSTFERKIQIAQSSIDIIVHINSRKTPRASIDFQFIPMQQTSIHTWKCWEPEKGPLEKRKSICKTTNFSGSVLSFRWCIHNLSPSWLYQTDLTGVSWSMKILDYSLCLTWSKSIQVLHFGGALFG